MVIGYSSYINKSCETKWSLVTVAILTNHVRQNGHWLQVLHANNMIKQKTLTSSLNVK